MRSRALVVRTTELDYSTVTLFARLRGWSTSQPRRMATSRASSCSGTLAVMGLNTSRTAGTRMIQSAILLIYSSPSVATTMTLAPRALHSIRFDTVLS